MKQTFTVFLSVLFISLASAQRKEDIQAYVALYKDIALEEMVRTGIPASITLAQGILESGCGKSPLATKANNHFGIKCKLDWVGEKYYQDDDAPGECFRVYNSVRESYADHSDFLVNRPRYAALFTLSPYDYKGWAQGLKDAGYATNPKYPAMLTKYIEDQLLHEFDKTGMAMIEDKKKPIVAHTEQPKPLIIATTTAPMQAVPQVIVEPAEVKVNTQKQDVLVSDKVRPVYVVNGSKAIKSVGKEDPFTIAYNYDIDYITLLQYNDLEQGDHFKDGEYIFLQPKKTRGEIAAYVAKQGESIRDISQKTGVRVKDLYFKNQMKVNEQVYAGETIYLQDKRPAPPKTMSYAEFLKQQNGDNTLRGNTTTTAPNIANTNQYQVQQKDTLYSIARKFNTTVERIKETNAIGDTGLQPGQTLVISQ